MLPSAYDLQYFIVVAETLNVSRAAERLGIRQPSLSESLKRLEQSVGCTLFFRSKTGVQLTPEGKEFLSYSKDFLNDWTILKDKIKKTASTLSGIYSLGCHASVALYSLKHFLPQLLSEHPLLEIKLTHDLSRNICEQVISHKIDLGIVVNPVRHPDLLIFELARDEVVLWKSKTNPVCEDIIICDPQLMQSESILKRLGAAKLSRLRRLSTSNLEVAKSLAESGAGIAILPTRVALNDSNPKLVRVSASPIHEDKICLVLRAERKKHPGIQNWIKVIREAKL
jgi:DNA-binding transcriptional LysR family regulator